MPEYTENELLEELLGRGWTHQQIAAETGMGYKDQWRVSKGKTVKYQQGKRLERLLFMNPPVVAGA